MLDFKKKIYEFLLYIDGNLLLSFKNIIVVIFLR